MGSSNLPVSTNRTFGPSFWFPEPILSIKRAILNTLRDVLSRINAVEKMPPIRN
jgi:hypothetical protein